MKYKKSIAKKLDLFYYTIKCLCTEKTRSGKVARSESDIKKFVRANWKKDFGPFPEAYKETK